MNRDGEDEEPVEQDDTGTAQIHDVPLKRNTIAGFQVPLPLTDGGTLGDSNTPSTLAESWPTEVGPIPIAPGRAASMGTSSIARYTLGPILGRGGMGEVYSAHDEQIGRPVAIKRLRTTTPSDDALSRFLREARIQGRLEHPAIVPVHELWKDDQGRPFFVMKQLTGTTLADVLAKLAVGSPDAMKQFSRQRLLRAFSDVCLAIEFAHTRGVVHRDLKPANIVLGDFGETYVLDWGVSRVTDEQERPSFADIQTVGDAAPAYTETAAGAILGTPGYIAPEQIRGDADLDGRADVYALGTILFEMLTFYPLHPRGQAAIASALNGVDARPSRRAIDHVIPPELDAICVRATAVERRDRYPTARALGDAVQEFLDGDRDFALRRELARTELATARRALASGERRIAVRAAARALAFDPSSPQSADLLGRLMIEPPTETPKEVEREIDRLDMESLRRNARFGTFAALVYLLFFPVLYWIGFREAWYLIVGPALCGVIVFVEVAIAPRNPFVSGYLAIIANLGLLALLSSILSPFLIGAGPGIIMVMVLSTHQRLIKTWVLGALAAMSILSPWILEQAGVLADRTIAHGSTFVLDTAAGSLAPLPAPLALALYVVTLLIAATFVGRAQDNERRGERRSLQIQAWQLRELVPGAETTPA
ncbi:MAG: Serine/threonine protein kinase PrkC, regulator of stationary phase [Myxococcales bacterium]|nr:Serine/threonine protein kinase PrkC, regulator of stationary phase [Myxococcales bacterium]